MAGGPENRIELLKTLITALVKYERIELGYRKAFETQKYAERVSAISYASVPVIQMYVVSCVDANSNPRPRKMNSRARLVCRECDLIECVYVCK